jgi:hypothetical protein
MQYSQPTPDPFALMMNPDAIFAALERSGRLSRLKRRICRPLDKPLIPRVGDEVAAFDLEIDASMESVDEQESA